MAIAATDDEEISVKELLQLFWRQKLLIVCLSVTAALIAGVAAWSTSNSFEATVIVSPISNESGAGRLAGAASQMGGLASLIGISVGGDSRRAESVAILKSQALTQRYIRENGLLPILYADEWDAATGKWRTSDVRRQPTLWKASRLFDRIRVVSDDSKTGLVKLTITWKDPQLAAKWANDLVKLTNDTLRAKAIEESDKHIAYLNEEAQHTDVAQVRVAIYSVLESEIKNVMLAKGPGDYALKVIDPAVAPELKSGPKRLLWVLMGGAAGFILSLVVLFLRSAWQSAPHPA
jgi:uncharacterized protein involved in exopolysaccharide biosynthesis